MMMKCTPLQMRQSGLSAHTLSSPRSWRRYLCLSLLFWLLIPRLAQARQSASSIKDVLVLKQVGYNDAQILAHLKTTKTLGKYKLSPMQVLRLRKAGFSVKVIRAMGIAGLKPRSTPAARPVRVNEVRQWLGQKRQERWIEAQLKKRGLHQDEFNTSAILMLHQQGLSLSTLQLLYRLKQKAKIPAIRAQPEPRTIPRARPKAPAPRTPATPQILQQRYQQQAKRRLNQLPYPQSGLYRDIGHAYALKLPKGWRLYQDISPDSGALSTYITPDKVVTYGQLKRALWFNVSYLSEQADFQRSQTLKQLVRGALQDFLAEEPGLSLQGKLKVHHRWGLSTISADLKGRGKVRTSPTRMRVYIQKCDTHVIQLGYYAPPSQFDAFAKQAELLLKQLQRPDPKKALGQARLSKAETVQRVIQQNRRGVVSISVWVKHPKTGKGKFVAAGTGFLVSKKGHILTNHHVVVSSRTGKPYSKFMINWDQATGLKSQAATLLGAVRQAALRGKVLMRDPHTGRASARYQQQHVDIALLRITAPGRYPTVKLSSIRETMLGDTVVAMGFPGEGIGINKMGTDDVTATTGRISRLVLRADKSVNEVQHTAKIAGGNSGGPLFNINTGSVIGINTWVGVLDPRALKDPRRFARSAMGLGYYYALPVDLAWQYFPDYIAYQGKKLSDTNWYALAVQWAIKGQYKAAGRTLTRLIQRRPDFVPAYMQLARMYLSRAQQHSGAQRKRFLVKARRWADRAMQRDIDNIALMTLMGQITILSGDWPTAKYLLDRAIKLKPKTWTLYALRATMWSSRNDKTRALQDVAQAIRWLNNMLPNGYIQKGNILLGAGRYFESQQAFRRALRIAPQNLQAKIGEAIGYLMLKQRQEAITKLQVLLQQHPRQPKIYRALIMSYFLSSRSKDVIGTYLKLKRLCDSLHRPVDARSLYYAGFVFHRLKYTPYQLGAWMSLFHHYNDSFFAAQAALLLTVRALKKRNKGLAHGWIQLINPQNLKGKLRKAYNRVRARVRPSGLSRKELLTVFTTARPLTLTQVKVAVKLFTLTPSVLDRTTLRILVRKGIPKTYLIRMIKLTKARQAREMRPASGKRTGLSPSTASKHKRAILQLRTLIRQALAQGDIDTWMAIRHPRANLTKYRKVFWQLHRMMLNHQVVHIPLNKTQLLRHPRYGMIIADKIRLRFRNGRVRRGYWGLGHTSRGWRLLGLFLY